MSSQRAPPPAAARRRSGANKAMKAYDHSPMLSPSATPPLSRKNSDTSVKSTQSEPQSDRGRRSRTQSYDSNASTKTDDSTSSFSSWFRRDKKRKPSQKDIDGKILTSKHAAAVKTKMMMDPEYKAFLEKHKKPEVKTAGISGGTRSAHSSAADQEARHPHSGPAHKTYQGLDMPALSKIESKDESDAEDDIQRFRREWNEAQEHSMADILELRSAPGSRLHSPIASRDPSPSRRPQPRSRNSYVGGRYAKTDTGAWVKKDAPPKRESPRSGTTPKYGATLSPDVLAQSLAERLEALR